MKTFAVLFASLLSFMSCFGYTDHTGYTEEDLYKSYAPDGIPFIVADSMWNADIYGNHRAMVEVKSDSRVVRVTLPWRRPDLRIESKGVIIVDEATGEHIKNLIAQEISAERGVLLFEPTSGSGKYCIYYMPYYFLRGWNEGRIMPKLNRYLPAEYNPNKEWVDLVESIENIPDAKVLYFEERSRFDAFTSMGNIATASETEQLRKSAKTPMVLFPEDRVFQIRLKNNLPVRWVQQGPSSNFKGVACRNEYYTWQVGVWAAKSDLNNLKIEFSDLRSAKNTIVADSITCFNLEGVNWDGTPLSFDVDVKQGEVQALWCGVQIPKDTKAGVYRGKLSVSATGVEPQKIDVTIKVLPEILEDRGEGDLWRMARLRWLNSQIGMSDSPTRDYKDVILQGNTITATDKKVIIGKSGLPASIKVGDREVLHTPYNFVVKTAKGDICFDEGDLKFTSTSAGSVKWQSHVQKQGIDFSCKALMEFDGYMHYEIEVSADEEMEVENIYLQSNYSTHSSKYFMGAAHSGGLCPENYRWDWQGNWDSYWIGGAEGGVRVELRGGSYNGPLMRDYKPEPPISWANKGKGYLDVKGGTTALVVAGSGTHTLKKEPLCFEFDLQITPVKPVNTAKHFEERYYHRSPSGFNKSKKDGANISNIHHSNSENPFINYPFIAGDKLKSYINEQHKDSCRVKVYYTVRELSNYTHEIYALRSLGHEIFTGGEGYGTPWLHEHLIDDYAPAWYTELSNCTADAALVLTSFSRWINYYLEGLRWMFENYGIDGIYMDDVSFDRPVMKRMRRIMDTYHTDALIDLHSNTLYSFGPAQQYTGFYPYINRLWYGEEFQYDKMTADEWFVTFSGIPYGLMSDMLAKGGNPWLGMVYGATARIYGGTHSPVPMWKLWKEWGISQSKMIGYWAENPIVTTSHPEVKATTYVKEDGAMIAVGNFSENKQTVKLDIDWKSLGLNPTEVEIHIPEIEAFQTTQSFNYMNPITIDPKRGNIIIITKKHSLN